MSLQVFRGSFRAMGCEFRVCVAVPDAGTARRAMLAARSHASHLELLLSRFREDSELSRLNRSSGSPVRVHPVLWRALRWALWAARATGGLYDPTLLDQLEAAGYGASFEQLPAAEGLPDPDPAVFGRWRLVRLHRLRPVVFLPPGLRVDLGGVGKAYAAEQLAAELRRFGPCLVEAGGDVAVRGVPPGWPGWPVAVEATGGTLGALWLRRGGLATSGTDVRRWRAGHQVAHHLIDPRTGLPARTDVASATVLARHAVEANAHALALVVLGTEAAELYLAHRTRVRAVVVRRDGRLWFRGLALDRAVRGSQEEVG
ncbi:MAG: FAD:protein FMN transferase [Armatimonadota bacterium]|nr:FAD:protein FMN transferase [Armatimonadota bacterium]MDR7389834.1 FAD:protein FMN transferase [Armatimonadota bacterium]MDR7393636.1 FAD:protein FMN transferase [Armatimonadota bacterium]MDR7396053.1 FAD:protein FMN transferase [Armatimonadota bacterium]MDR7399538.1 FAD:protein FMN transferase [Armatimonadota bacterium]